jgi:hypothetical protein
MRLLIVEFSFDDPSPRDKAGIGKEVALGLAQASGSYVVDDREADPPAEALSPKGRARLYATTQKLVAQHKLRALP